ncbi:MAG: sigma 54-interacting transcriptional regulator [Smithella sp.]
MKKEHMTREQLLAENDDLRRRLEEAEETLQAIHHGEVDALVVAGPEGEQVFTLKGAEYPYRILLETMQEGAVTMTTDGNILYCNNRFAQLIKMRPAQVINLSIYDVILPADKKLFEGILQDTGKGELSLCAKDETHIPVYLSCSSLELDDTPSVSMVVTDLTEQKRNEEILQAEKLSRSILDQATEVIIVCDEKGQITRASRMAHELCGTNLLCHYFDDIFSLAVSREDAPSPRFSIATPLQGEIVISVEVSFLRDDGKVFELLLSARPLFDQLKKIAGCVVTLVDITEMKKSAAALLESKERYKELVTNANSIIIRMDQKGTITFFNEFAQKFFGYAPDEILGKDIKILIPQVSSSGKNLVEMADNILRNPDAFEEVINENIRKNGECVWILWSNKAIRDADGNIIGNLAVGRDITRRKHAEEALHISETRYRRLFETSRDGILILDADTGQISDVNPFLMEMLGYSHEDFLGKKLWDIGAFKNIGATQDVFFELQANGYVRYEDLPLETKDGRPIAVEFISNVYRVNSHKVIQCNIRDITDRKLAAEALQKAHDELEQRVDERTLELRTALAKIKVMKNQLEAENIYFRQEIKMRHRFKNILGKSDGLEYVLYRAEQVAPTNTTVLILGETGTGKELIAEAIHNMSPRKDRPLFTVNCAALPANLIESELFGREKGAFTGADTRQIGRFEIANGSTLCLDEIGELPLEMQAKLLRAIQHNEFERLGSSRTIKVDTRILATTNRDLEEEVRKGRFRQDLYYRLNVFPITVPPLRQRVEDIPILVTAFVERYAREMGKSITSIPKETMEALQNYPWPGNVRELESVIERAIILCHGTSLQLADKLEIASPTLASTVKTLEEMERNQILKTISETSWRIEGKDGAATILGLHPSTLRARMHKLGIMRPDSKGMA